MRGGVRWEAGGGAGHKVSGVNRVCHPGFVAFDPLKTLFGYGAGGFMLTVVQKGGWKVYEQICE